ncbi:MAG TPA: hypothetical protein VHR47_12405 [Bacillota bacterium]|nr:hypothetical protein [Bacillota bacterium]
MISKHNLKTLLIVKLLLATVLSFTIPCFGAGQGELKHYKCAAQGFSFAIPSHWQQAPEETLKDLKENNTEDDLFISQFQVESGNGTAEYPLIAISVTKQFVLPQAELDRYKAYHITDIKTFYTDPSLANIWIYDRPAQTVWGFMRGKDGEGISRVNITAMRLTKTGMIDFSYLNDSDQYTETAEEFLQVVNSITLHKDVAESSQGGTASDADSAGSSDPSVTQGIIKSTIRIAFYAFIMIATLVGILRKGKKKSNVDTLNNKPPERNENPTQINEVYVDAIMANRRKIRITLSTTFGVVGLALLVLDAVYSLKNHEQPIWALIGSAFATTGMMAVMFGFVYLIVIKRTIWFSGSYRLNLSEDGLHITSDTLPNIEIDRIEIQGVEELEKGLRVDGGSMWKRVTIPKTLKNYNEIKAIVEVWFKESQEQDSVNF